MINEKELEKILNKIVDSLQALKTGIQDHEHNESGLPVSDNVVKTDISYSSTFTFLDDEDVEKIFCEPKKPLKKK